jgi:2-C-methyl-D-erythritol 2,4-cyclodiphosphate synthase
MSEAPRIGSGMDVHAFGAERPGATVVLAGVPVPADAPLEGHSDADVAAHAVIDALLGAAGLGDIGSRFGVDDPALDGADSMTMLTQVMSELGAIGWRVGNVDLTIVASRPHIAAHREAMRRRLASALDAEWGAVSVKATTTDGLGSVGRGEGVAAWAVVLLVGTGGRDGSGQPAE